MNTTSSLRLSTAIASLLLAACSVPDSISGPSGAVASRFPGTQALNVDDNTIPQSVTVCKVGPAGTTATFSLSSTGGGALPLGTLFTLNANPTGDGTACAEVWKANEKDGLAWFVTVSETGSSAGTELASILQVDYFGSVTFVPPVASSTVITNFDHPAKITFTNVAVEPPPVCVGLTPGYWKNWRNHYTAAQFASLLPGTIASSIANADAIFAAKGKNSIEKLKWFVLANQLTLNLTGTDLPNPSGGNLTGLCANVDGGSQLGGTLGTALDILNGVGGPYTDAYILSIKDILDAIANLDPLV